jgi:hypothetical protein
MTKYEAQWNAKRKTFAWFSKEPDYLSGSLCWFWLDDPKAPCKRLFRFSLIGGGQVATVENWRWFRYLGGRKIWPANHYTWKDDDTYLSYEQPRHGLIVKAHTPAGLVRHHGFIDGYTAECSADAAVFDKHVPQEIADRIAATLAAIGRQEEVFYALLDGSEGCAFCHRPLRDEVSKLVGVGADCARQNRIPHSMAAASRRLELRRKILGEPELKH